MRKALAGATDFADLLSIIRDRVTGFENDAHRILSKYEGASRSRIITIDQTRRQLEGLSARQQLLLEEAVSCIEFGLFRAAHVTAWQAFVDFLLDKLFTENRSHVYKARPAWEKFVTLEDFREEVPEHQIIQAARDIRLISKAEMRSLHGHLSTRNQCAHPSNYQPGLNETLGYISDLLRRMRELQAKTLQSHNNTTTQVSER